MRLKAMLMLSLFTTASLWVGGAPDDKLLAISGCCKERSSASDPWYRSGSDLKICKDLNQADGDNIFDPAGKVWWDLAC